MDRSGAAGQMCVLSQTFVCSRLPSPTAGSFGQTAPEPSCVSSRLQAASRGITMKKWQPGHGAEFLPGGHRFRTAATGSPGVSYCKALGRPPDSRAGPCQGRCPTSRWHPKDHTNYAYLRQPTIIWRMQLLRLPRQNWLRDGGTTALPHRGPPGPSFLTPELADIIYEADPLQSPHIFDFNIS